MPRKKKLIPLRVLDEAHRVLEQFPELRGRNDYPEMVKFLDKVGSGHDAPNLYSECFQAAFGTAWEQSGKQIYTFDFELAHALATQTDLAVAADTLKRLPFRCGYVQLPKTIRYNGWPADGFFAYLHDDELELLVCGANGRWFGRAPVKLTAKTFAESWAMTENLPGLPTTAPPENANDAGMSVCVQALLYLCAQNADLARTSPVPAVADHPSRDAKQAKKLPVQSWSVGVRVGQTIKANRRRYERTGGTSAPHGTHARPRPHLRSGHWSHFWTGKRDSADRERILKWIEPTYINAGSPDELPVTIRKVEK